MGTDLGLSVAQNTRAAFLQAIPRRDDVFDLIADVVDATGRVLFQKTVDRAIVPQRVKQFDFGIGQFDKDHGDAVVGFILRGANIRTQSVAVLIRSGLKVRHGDGYVV